MGRSSFVLGMAASLSLLVAGAGEARAEKLERPKITTSLHGGDLTIVVHNVTDYCSTNADTRIERSEGTIRILRDRPTRVSRCFSTQDLTFVVPAIGSGRYVISYERLPLVAPARWVPVASTTAFVDGP